MLAAISITVMLAISSIIMVVKAELNGSSKHKQSIYGFKQTAPGIMFSRNNMHNSIARNNYIQDQDRAIVVSDSHEL